MNQERFRGKKALIVGFARSGAASASLLEGLGAKVWITDNQDNPILRRNLAELSSKNIQAELGRHTREFVKDKDIVIISPGVPGNALPVLWAKEKGIPVISEIELGWLSCPGQVIAITGTNGKTTVTTLVGKVLAAAGRKVFVCGNIGKPFCSEVSKMRPGDFVSLEISSFQLENIATFKPGIAVILNLSRNHLDRYQDMGEYLAAKKRIFKNQESADHLVLNDDDPAIRSLAREARSKVTYFRRQPGFNPNQSAVLAIASILGIGGDLCRKVFGEFKGVEHRLEEVGNVGGVRFINDSKSTTTEATLWALHNLSEPLVLIAGGREKGNDYTAVRELARKKVRAAILIGEARDKIRQAFSPAIDVDEAADLDEAVRKARQLARSGDCVLFSPMCKSFDMFTNFEERGERFKKIVADLA